MDKLEQAHRLVYIRENLLGLKQAEMARQLEYPIQQYNSYETGKTGISTSVLKRLLTNKNISPAYILCGIGDPYYSEESVKEIPDLIQAVIEGKEHSIIIRMYQAVEDKDLRLRFIEYILRRIDDKEREFLEEKAKRLELLEELIGIREELKGK